MRHTGVCMYMMQLHFLTVCGLRQFQAVTVNFKICESFCSYGLGELIYKLINI